MRQLSQTPNAICKRAWKKKNGIKKRISAYQKKYQKQRGIESKKKSDLLRLYKFS